MRAAWKGVTIHQLLTHTSGVPNPDYGSKQSTNRDRIGATPGELVALVASQPLDFTPGTKRNYSNTGDTLLGMLIKKLSGPPSPCFLASLLFYPLTTLN